MIVSLENFVGFLTFKYRERQALSSSFLQGLDEFE